MPKIIWIFTELADLIGKINLEHSNLQQKEKNTYKT